MKNPTFCVKQLVYENIFSENSRIEEKSSAANLFIITQKPYKSGTKSTVCQRIKLALKERNYFYKVINKAF